MAGSRGRLAVAVNWHHWEVVASRRAWERLGAATTTGWVHATPGRRPRSASPSSDRGCSTPLEEAVHCPAKGRRREMVPASSGQEAEEMEPTHSMENCRSRGMEPLASAEGVRQSASRCPGALEMDRFGRAAAALPPMMPRRGLQQEKGRTEHAPARNPHSRRGLVEAHVRRRSRLAASGASSIARRRR